MDAADYYEWYRFSGVGLGTQWPGERFEQLHKELSTAGANLVIICEFVGENSEVIDVSSWRMLDVTPYEAMRVKLTVLALEAVGAHDTANAVREAKGPLAAGAQKSPFAGTRGQLRKLATEYADLHSAELEADIGKFGDLRQDDDFDADARLRELEEENTNLARFGRQRDDLPDLLEKLNRLKRRLKTDAPDSRRVRNEQKWLMEDYERYSEQDPGGLIPEIRQWLEDVQALCPAMTHPKLTDDAKTNSRLAAIGDYTTKMCETEWLAEWQKPGLETDWVNFSLEFYVELDETPKPAKAKKRLGQLLAEWERFRKAFPKLLPEITGSVIDHFKNEQANDRWGNDWSDYADEDGQISEEKILANVEDAGVVLTDREDEGVVVSIQLDVPWDVEHGVEIAFDGKGRIVRDF